MLLSRGFLVASAGILLGTVLMMMCAPTSVMARTLDEIVASVDGNPITMYDVRAFAALTGNTLPAYDTTSSPIFKQVLKALIERDLIRQELKKYQSRVSPAQVNGYIQGIERQRGLTDQQFRQVLAQNGVTYDAFRKQARMQLEKAMMINDQVRDKIAIPESEIKAYYDAHKSDFMVTHERYKLAQILIAVPQGAPANQVAAARAKAEMVRKKALAGGNFAELARKYSDDSSRSKGGELGYFRPGQIMDQIFAAIKPLKPGQISKIVRSQYGFHIVKVQQHEMPGPLPLADVKDQIREKLLNEATEKRAQEWVDTQLVKQHYVETLY